uniref:Ovule protein n=1 Tax=Panagrellus redivivus TaxID=6233 RepID=A0A7E4UX53_PANRE
MIVEDVIVMIFNWKRSFVFSRRKHQLIDDRSNVTQSDQKSSPDGTIILQLATGFCKPNNSPDDHHASGHSPAVSPCHLHTVHVTTPCISLH